MWNGNIIMEAAEADVDNNDVVNANTLNQLERQHLLQASVEKSLLRGPAERLNTLGTEKAVQRDYGTKRKEAAAIEEKLLSGNGDEGRRKRRRKKTSGELER